MSDLARTSIELTVFGTAAAWLVIGLVLGFWLSDLFRSAALSPEDEGSQSK